MTSYTIQVSDHPEAHLRIATAASTMSWEIVHDGPLASDETAREAIKALGAFSRRPSLLGFWLEQALAPSPAGPSTGCDARRRRTG
jgi:hypothetical protein